MLEQCKQYCNDRVSSIFFIMIMNSHNDQLPVRRITQLVGRYSGKAEVRVQSSLWPFYDYCLLRSDHVTFMRCYHLSIALYFSLLSSPLSASSAAECIMIITKTDCLEDEMCT